ncbi:hypothetical protein [Billgrantia gudaonensis]|uniref:hypothetical protein n=1 Tax=Billgrantia gudaonensis TaxID=376427 RepID=UPI0015A0A681|nr:hypothetical protein [Halomonas gudaonensis]
MTSPRVGGRSLEAETPDLLAYSVNIRILEALEATDRLPGRDRQRLMEPLR